MIRLAVAIAVMLGLMLVGARAETGRRVALVIGNGTYQATGKLTNPVNDATDVAAGLRAVGFDVIEGLDLGKRDLERKIGEFADKLDPAGTALFFYAGHGLQVEGRNYIVPVDAEISGATRLQLETVPMNDVLDIMEAQSATSIVFLDACRNNPFASDGTTSDRGARAVAGLTRFGSSRGSFIAFSTAPGSVAMDGAGRNSPFATALVKHMADPGQSISDLMISVRRDVMASTGDKQRPWEQGSLTERFEFVPSGLTPGQVAPADSPPPAQVATAERSVGDTGSVEYMIVHDYLSPRADAIAESVKRLYGDPVLVYGTPMNADALLKAKSDWFAQWSSWKLAMEPGTLVVTPQGDKAASATFSMTYDYAPKTGAAHIVGRSRVLLSLSRAGEGGWRIVAESSQPL